MKSKKYLPDVLEKKKHFPKSVFNRKIVLFPEIINVEPFGEVFMASEKNGIMYIMKKFDLKELSKQEKLDFYKLFRKMTKEIKRLEFIEELDIWNVLKYHGYIYRDESKTFEIYFENFDCSMEDYLLRNDPDTQTFQNFMDLLLQMGGCLSKLQHFNIIHQDISLRKILLKKNPDGGFTYFLCEFSLAKIDHPDFFEFKSPLAGSSAYMSPQMFVFSQKKSIQIDFSNLWTTSKDDVFSFGIVIIGNFIGIKTIKSESFINMKLKKDYYDKKIQEIKEYLVSKFEDEFELIKEIKKEILNILTYVLNFKEESRLDGTELYKIVLSLKFNRSEINQIQNKYYKIEEEDKKTLLKILILNKKELFESQKDTKFVENWDIKPNFLGNCEKIPHINCSLHAVYEEMLDTCPDIEIKGKNLVIENKFDIEGDPKTLSKICPKIKLMETKVPFTKKMHNSVSFFSPLVEIQEQNNKETFEISIIPDLPLDFSLKNISICKISQTEKGVEKLEPVKTKVTIENGKIICKININHFCIFAVHTSKDQLQNFLQQKANKPFERTCDRIFNSHYCNTEQEILNSLDQSDRNQFNDCLQWVHKNFDSLPTDFKKVPKVGLACIRFYTSEFYRKLNKNLRNKKESQWIQYINKMRPYLNSIIWGLKSLDYHWETTYRGITTKDDENNFKSNQYVCFNDFLSTSTIMSESSSFGSNVGTLLKIKGQTGRYVKPLSVHPLEEEVLFMPGTVFIVKNIQKNVNSKDLIDMEEVIIPFGQKKLFWVDDAPMGNLNLMMDQERKGVSVFWRTSTQEFTEWLVRENQLVLDLSFDNCRIITDMVRKEGGKTDFLAGVNLIKILRDHGYNNKVLIYCGDKKKAKNNCIDAKIYDEKLVIIANLEEEVQNFLFN